MKSNLNNSSREMRRFRVLADKVNHLIRTGKFTQLSDVEQTSLLTQLKRFYARLKFAFSRRRLARVLAAAGMFIGITAGSPAMAQTPVFGPVQTNPFAISPSTYFSFPTVADMDNDGDLDILVGEYYGVTRYYENTGTPTVPAFPSSVQSPFGLDTISPYYAFPTSADLDADGDVDLLFGGYYGELKYFVNVGTPTAPQFGGGSSNPFGLTQRNEIAFPTFVDLDADGDYDLMVNEYDSTGGIWQYFENIGTATSPNFGAAQQNPFGLQTTGGYYATSSFADLDQDGDLDLLYSNYPGTFSYVENVGSATAPSFGAVQMNPFNFDTAYYIGAVRFCDLDADGDMDLLHGEFYGDLVYYEQTGFLVSNEVAKQTKKPTIYPVPAGDRIEILFDETDFTGEVNIAVLGMRGRPLIRETISADYSAEVDLAKLPAGAYFLRVTQGDKRSVQRFVKQ